MLSWLLITSVQSTVVRVGNTGFAASAPIRASGFPNRGARCAWYRWRVAQTEVSRGGVWPRALLRRVGAAAPGQLQ